MLELEENSHKIYSTLINSIKNLTLAEFLKMKKRLDDCREDKQRFLEELKDLKILHINDITTLETYYGCFRKIPLCESSKNELSFVIKPDLKERIGRKIQGYDSPGYESTPVKT